MLQGQQIKLLCDRENYNCKSKENGTLGFQVFAMITFEILSIFVLAAGSINLLPHNQSLKSVKSCSNGYSNSQSKSLFLDLFEPFLNDFTSKS